jgi:REP element-mobilizing transposase RayT
MPNHVHVLLQPNEPASRVLQWIKGSSARAVNSALGTTGHPLWQGESYDRVVRGEEEFRRIARYIAMNPVKAGLVERAEDWKWGRMWDGLAD